MKYVGTRGQQVRDVEYVADSSIASGGTAQLVLPEAKSRSYLFIQNLSDTDMYFEFGSARATATLTGGAVSSCSVTNAGFGFTYPPKIEFLGGSYCVPKNTASVGVGQPGYPAPSRPAQASCVLTTGAVSSIQIDDPGAGYIVAPYVLITNSLRDPVGCALPASGVGMYLGGGQSFYRNGTTCPTDAIAVFCAASSKKFLVRWMD